MTNKLIYGDNLVWLEKQQADSYNFIYIDPPFNTGKVQTYNKVSTLVSLHGDRKGFQGKTYQTIAKSKVSYVDIFDDFLLFIAPRLEHAHRLLTKQGTLCVHLDYREVHYVKVFLDILFGRDNFLNEIIWAYDYGGRGKRSWPKKHDTILVYTKTADYIFNWNDIERIPYMAPGLVTKEKQERGKVPTDVWWNTIVPTNSKERTKYPTQKPQKIIERLISASSNPGDCILDFFAGSGTTGVAAHNLGRKFIMIDNNDSAISVMRDRFSRKEIPYEFESIA